MGATGNRVGLCALFRRKKRLFGFVFCHLGEVCDRRDPGTDWWVFVEHSEIPRWKELMKYEIIAQSCQCQGREGFISTNASAATSPLLFPMLMLPSLLPRPALPLAGLCSPHPQGRPFPPAPPYQRPCSTTLTSPALSLLPAWIVSQHLMRAVTPCLPPCLRQQEPTGMRELALGDPAIPQGSKPSS